MASSTTAQLLNLTRHASRTSQSLLRPRHSSSPIAYLKASTFVPSRHEHTGSSTTKKQHTVDKTDRNDIQSQASGQGMSHKAAGTGGTATSQKDSTGSTDKARKEHPEAPKTIIGMQDERGQKGH